MKDIINILITWGKFAKLQSIKEESGGSPPLWARRFLPSAAANKMKEVFNSSQLTVNPSAAAVLNRFLLKSLRLSHANITFISNTHARSLTSVNTKQSHHVVGTKNFFNTLTIKKFSF